MTQKKPRKRPKSSATRITTQLRRAIVWLITVGAVSVQATSCGFLTEPSNPPSFSEQSGPRVATQFSGCRQFFAGGVAPIVPRAALQRELCYDAFAVLHSGRTKTPVFVAERLNHASIEDVSQKRTNKFFAEARLPRGERAELNDYKGSGYARGHMAPAGDMPTATAMAQSFSLANMIPQNPAQNSGAWAKVEEDTRRFALRAKGDVFIITGPVFGPESTTIGSGGVRVPTHLFKLVFDESTGKAWAHWQQNSVDARTGRPISYEALTQLIGMELMPGREAAAVARIQ